MRKKIFYFLTGIILAMSGISAHAQNATVATVPEGMISFSLPQGATSYFSLPLTNNATYASSVTAVTAGTISVGDTPAPFTTSLTTAAAPYFVKFLTGNETGRVLLITANTTSSLTLDTTDHAIGSPVLLTATGYNVQVGDTFEIFPGNTLASVFGTGTTQSPLLLTGGTNGISSDTVSLCTTSTARAITYYFNTTDGYWKQNGATGNANNTIIYPYSALTVTRRHGNPATTLVVAGQVTPVAAAIKVAGNGCVYTSTQYASDVTLSQLQIGSNWVTGTSTITADSLSVWDVSENRFDTYYQEPDSTWRKYPDAVTDQSSFAITAGTVITINKREAVTSATSFLQPPLPYSLD
jgi:uncharacterized protein (TIGR02597 family)